MDGRLEGWEDRINRPKHQLRQSKSPRRCQKIPQFDSCVEFFARTRFPNQRGNRFLQRCAQIYDDANAFLSSESFVSLARWADQNDGIRRKLVARSDGLFFAYDLNQGMTLLPLPDLDEALLDCVWEYRRAS
ncbi:MULTISPECIES: hypothetical protein [unclassified Bradyrhizobium]|uniref:hypothetical protein n=1 Tax=unclassified Bradyrhizobium TaxID=2631580 RepID=UPI001FF857FF|nr:MULTISPECIES: hypothetical protein [unclassified Bradyrhizobium]MCK1316620.1 hypothetical protein [Bradyrhizobium sp. 23]MCK1439764.1 hypothetical protein [Bradyrhizobium sp. 15]